jgi:esterase/lipase superfamily enzyme
VDSIDGESFYGRWLHPAARIQRHLQYEAYLLHEVLPLSQAKNPHPFMITHGCSFGAYHAVNFALRHPYQVGRVLALSGKYDMTSFFDGYYDSELYLNTPNHFVANLHDPGQLDALRRMDIILVTGSADPYVENNRGLSHALWGRGIWHAYREWDGWCHDWPYWKSMVRTYVGGSD